MDGLCLLGWPGERPGLGLAGTPDSMGAVTLGICDYTVWHQLTDSFQCCQMKGTLESLWEHGIKMQAYCSIKNA